MRKKIIKKLPRKAQKALAHEGFMRYFKNTLWRFGDQILRIISALLVGIWLTRYLGPKQYGLFSYALSFSGLFTVIAVLGLNDIVVRELAKDKTRKEELVTTSFGLGLLGALLSLALVWIALLFSDNDSYTNKLIFICALASIFNSFWAIDYYFQSQVLNKYGALTTIVSIVLSSIIKIIFILLRAPLEAFAWLVVFDSMVIAIGFLFFYIKKTPQFRLTQVKFHISTAKYLLKNSAPLILGSIFISVYMRIDQVMINEMINTEAVGQYAVAVRLSEIWYFIPGIISMSIFPAIVHAKQQSESLYRKRLQQLYNLMIWVSVSIAIPMTFLSNWIVNLLYGQVYNEAGSVLMIHIWTGIFVFVGVASSRCLTAENLQKISLYRTLIGCIINIVLNYILIPIMGIKGAAVATLISQAFAGYLCLFFWRRTRYMFIAITKSIFFISR